VTKEFSEEDASEALLKNDFNKSIFCS